MADVIEGGHRRIKNTETNGEFDITEAKGGTEGIGGGGLSILPGTVEIKEGDVGHVDHSMLEGRGAKGGKGMCMVNEAEGSGSYALGGRVGTSPTGKLLAEAVVKGVGSNETAIRGPHAGHRLANGAEGVFHCSRSDWETIFGKAAVAVALCKDL